MSPVMIGSFGVGLLLAAFVLNLLRVLNEQGRIYLLMNVVGAGLACWYAYRSGSLPFVILEAVWALTALFKLILPDTKNPRVAGG